MASRLKLLNNPAKSPQPRGRHHKNVRPEVNMLVRRSMVLFVAVGLITIPCSRLQGGDEHLLRAVQSEAAEVNKAAEGEDADDQSEISRSEDNLMGIALRRI
jgi:hypothetical protein